VVPSSASLARKINAPRPRKKKPTQLAIADQLSVKISYLVQRTRHTPKLLNPPIHLSSRHPHPMKQPEEP